MGLLALLAAFVVFVLVVFSVTLFGLDPVRMVALGLALFVLAELVGAGRAFAAGRGGS